MTSKLFAIVAGMTLLALFTLPAPAAERQILRGHVPGAMSRLGLQPVGRLPATNCLDLLIGLPLRNMEDFTNQMARLYDPRSTSFHDWLTPDQIARRYGPTDKDYQAVIEQVKSNGLTVIATHADHTLLRVRGAVAGIEKMFHVTMRTYQHPTEARMFFAPDVEPSVDLSIPLLHVTGLNNFTIPHSGTAKARSRGPVEPDDTPMGSGPTNSFWGNDFRAAYVPGTRLTGSGQILGLLELDSYYPNDIAAYINNSGISTSVTLTNIPVDGGVGAPGTENKEVALDIEMAIAMAPGLSKIVVYEASGSGLDWIDILKRMEQDNNASQLSASWNYGDDPNADVVYQEFAMQGQSFLLSSGDNGAYYQGVAEWTDDPFVTIVGGTSLATTKAGGAWASERVWNDGPAGRQSGGGISAGYFGNYSIPGWQQGVTMSLNGGSTTMRNVPDVAIIADNLYIVYNNGQIDFDGGGTSAAAPLWAAFTALVNEQAVANRQPAVGFLNPAIYAIGQGANYANCLHDVTFGQNSGPTSPGVPPPAIYYATNGFDLCTGWGSPNGVNLINALMPYTGATWVDFKYAGSITNGSYQYPFKKLADGVASVHANGNIWIKTSGSSSETLKISKAMAIEAAAGPVVIGN